MSLTDTVRLRGLTGALALCALCAGASAQTTITVGPHPPLPNGEVGVAYSQSLTASETPLASPTCCTWSVTRGSLGSLNLTFSGLNNTNALISGTPGAGDAGTLSFTVTASDTLILANGKQAYSITIFPQLQITGASLPTGQPGVLYPSITLGATGGTGSYTWSLASGSPPPGLTLNPDGTIGPGTPTTVGTFPFTAQVADGITTATLGFSITIAPPPLVLQTTSLPSGEAGAPYSAPLSATGGVPPYNWSASGLPHGLGVNPSTGIISGPLAPDATTSTHVVLKVTDSTSTSTSSLPLTLTVTPGPSITSSSPLPNGEATAPYSQTLTATGGATPYTWAVTGGSLPAGLSLGAGGVLSGAPTAAALGTSSFTVKVTDRLNGTATQTMSITVIAGPTVNTASVLPNGTVGVAYTNVTLAASNGTQPYTWLISTGSLPQGLSLSGNAGAITGQPTASGTSNFTVQVRGHRDQTIQHHHCRRFDHHDGSGIAQRHNRLGLFGDHLGCRRHSALHLECDQWVAPHWRDAQLIDRHAHRHTHQFRRFPLHHPSDRQRQRVGHRYQGVLADHRCESRHHQWGDAASRHARSGVPDVDAGCRRREPAVHVVG